MTPVPTSPMVTTLQPAATLFPHDWVLAGPRCAGVDPAPASASVSVASPLAPAPGPTQTPEHPLLRADPGHGCPPVGAPVASPPLTGRSSVECTAPVFPSSKPRRRTSARSVTPLRSATTRRTCSISACTSSAAPALVRLDEVGVLLRHLRRAEPEALQPGRLDEPPGRVALGIGEHRAGVGATGLMLAAPSHDGGHRRLFVLHRSRRDPDRPPPPPGSAPPTRTGSRRTGEPTSSVPPASLKRSTQR